MGQAEILAFLKKHKEQWFTSKEIMNHLGGARRSSIIHCLSKLRYADFVDFKSKHGSRSNILIYKYNEGEE